MPNFLIALIVASVSSEINKFFAFESPSAKEENKIHLMLILLSPLMDIVLLNGLIFLLSVYSSFNSN